MAAIRRTSHQLPGIDPRSPMTLTIPQHQILTSFQSLPSPSPFQLNPQGPSPFSHSPSPFTFRAPQNTPISPISMLSNNANLLFDIAPSPVQRQNRDRSSSLKFLLQTGRVPSVLTNCPCGQGRQTTSHILKSCPHFSSERESLIPSSATRTPMTPTPASRIGKGPKSPGLGMKSPRSPGRTKEQKVVHMARKWRMRTLLGRYRRAVQMQRLEGFGNPKLGLQKGMVERKQKSPRPDVVELGLVGEGFKDKLRRGFT